MESCGRDLVVEAELDAALQAMPPAGVRLGLRRITPDDVPALFEVEAVRVRQSAARRRGEFASGRVLLRELIGQDVAIPVAENRAPVMPPGVCGSLAHDAEYAIAAVSVEPGVIAIGIDLEPAVPLEQGDAALVLRPDESALDAHLAFTMKEAAYKAWSALGGRMLDHRDVRVSVRGGTFLAEVVDDGARLEGTWTEAAGRWITLVVVGAAAERRARPIPTALAMGS